MAARHVVLTERKLITYVYAVGCYRVGIKARGSCLLVSQYACQRHSHWIMDGDRDAAYAFYGMLPLIFDGTRRTVSLAGWLHDMESIFRICHIEAHLQVSLASRCLAVDARLWWMSLGESAIPGGSWADFRALIIAYYGPLPNKEADIPYRDTDIYITI
ncbi:hypothetical protein TIFTF001_022318 [Ficus carica]|uniref:Uncharacterized protein n=1 Tax=Ficus carica TaxID=3494 RepID=A0AA88AVN6_FICCA|nr:hypothetical protein TIFTF001_022318 [Ficus carica]